MGDALNENEKKELERKTRAAELGAKVSVRIRAGGKRTELETRRKMARDLFGLG
jgi:hypothetical protein